MITIIDGSETLRGKTVRKLLIKSGFPCNLCNPNEFINSKDAVISFKLSDCKSVMDEELIILADGKAFGNSARRRIELNRIVERCADLLGVKYGVNVESFGIGRLYVDGNKAHIRGNALRITYTEKLILKYLSFYSHRWNSISDIANHCIDSKSINSIPVHIHNINQKTRFYSCIPLIESKRNIGYKIII